MTQEQEFITAYLEDAIGSDEHPTLLHFGWFNYDGGELGLSLCTGNSDSSVLLEFPFEPELYALGADNGAETYETNFDMRHYSPSDFFRHSEDLKDFLADARHVARRAQRALTNRPDQMS